MKPAVTLKAAANEGLKKVLAHPITWVVALILIVLAGLAVRRAMASAWAKWTTPKPTGQPQLPGTPPLVTETPFGDVVNEANPRVAQLRALTTDLYEQMKGLPSWNDRRPELMMQLAALNDQEVIFCATYYETLGGSTMRQDVAGEWSVIPASAREDLLKRLAELHL